MIGVWSQTVFVGYTFIFYNQARNLLLKFTMICLKINNEEKITQELLYVCNFEEFFIFIEQLSL